VDYQCARIFQKLCEFLLLYNTWASTKLIKIQKHQLQWTKKKSIESYISREVCALDVQFFLNENYICNPTFQEPCLTGMNTTHTYV
jgi:hypothetical protein